jgi:hypothetical protein
MASALGATDGFILAEAVVAHYPDLDTSGSIPYFLPELGIPNKTSWGYVAEIGINYPNLADSGITVTPQLDFAHDVKGTTPNALPFVEGRKSLTTLCCSTTGTAGRAACSGCSTGAVATTT